MLLKEQQIIISNYISYLNDEVKKHLCEMELLNNDGTLINSEDSHNEIRKWFSKAIDNETCETDREAAFVVINASDSYTGKPEFFDFPAKEFNLSYLK